jgi:hypothetical protein
VRREISNSLIERSSLTHCGRLAESSVIMANLK